MVTEILPPGTRRAGRASRAVWRDITPVIHPKGAAMGCKSVQHYMTMTNREARLDGPRGQAGCGAVGLVWGRRTAA